MSNASPPRSGGAQDKAGAPARRRIRIPFSLWLFPATSAVVALHLAGCWPLSYAEDCKEDSMYCPGETTGGGNGPGPTCKPDPTLDASTVVDRCAVFASASASASASPGGDGTKARPYASLSEAIANAKGKRVLACSSGVFKESVTVEAAVEVIGGFDCDAGWTWNQAARSAIEGPANKVALTLTEDAGGTRVRGFTISAVNATEPGGSSIGVAVADVEASLVDVAVTAGNGMGGALGETPELAQVGASAPALVSDACVGPPAVFGGEPGVTMCEDGESRGGVGGLGGLIGTDDGDGKKGQDGTPLPEENPNGTGLGGAGHGAESPSGCVRGADGAPGAAGVAGDRGKSTTLALAGVTGGDGGRGTGGTRGQGGGGGGGARAGLFCDGGTRTVEGVGASGGGGGAGGCGGKGGSGGKAGGSSIGILSLGTQLSLSGVTVTVGAAGNGGKGGNGRAGGRGGSGSNGGDSSGISGSKPGCAGAMGGTGGDGGPGGGGRGGHAVGIAYAITPSQAPALEFINGGAAGDGGVAGLGGPPESNGAAGASGACWDFASNTSCPQQ
ncbi:hypothetical protein [Sorangium sp. So ce1000]|uniref:hypothetical protein n=1 Tax=Sorangium sp. So ce1000 TaxID=3133325 RepID=UPI003F63A9E7